MSLTDVASHLHAFHPYILIYGQASPEPPQGADNGFICEYELHSSRLRPRDRKLMSYSDSDSCFIYLDYIYLAGSTEQANALLDLSGMSPFIFV